MPQRSKTGRARLTQAQPPRLVTRPPKHYKEYTSRIARKQTEIVLRAQTGRESSSAESRGRRHDGGCVNRRPLVVSVSFPTAAQHEQAAKTQQGHDGAYRDLGEAQDAVNGA